jgi:hypothetical protein
MIYDVMNFLKQKLETGLAGGRGSSEPLVQLSAPWSINDTNQHSTFLNAISLINIEEEAIFKSQIPAIVQKPNGQFYKQQPPVKLNLYAMVSSWHKSYEDGLKFLSRVIGFFQAHPVFQKDELPEGIDKIIVEMYTAGWEQQNQIWGSLSTAYIPSVIYKVRMVVVDQAPADEPAIPIKEIKTSF